MSHEACKESYDARRFGAAASNLCDRVILWTSMSRAAPAILKQERGGRTPPSSAGQHSVAAAAAQGGLHSAPHP